MSSGLNCRPRRQSRWLSVERLRLLGLVGGLCEQCPVSQSCPGFGQWIRRRDVEAEPVGCHHHAPSLHQSGRHCRGTTQRQSRGLEGCRPLGWARHRRWHRTLSQWRWHWGLSRHESRQAQAAVCRWPLYRQALACGLACVPSRSCVVWEKVSRPEEVSYPGRHNQSQSHPCRESRQTLSLPPSCEPSAQPSQRFE